MTIKLELPPELEPRLRNQAELAGMDVDRFVLALVRAGLQFTETVETAAEEEPTELSYEEWSARFHDWVENFPKAKGQVQVDDSRESIYEDRV